MGKLPKYHRLCSISAPVGHRGKYDSDKESGGEVSNNRGGDINAVLDDRILLSLHFDDQCQINKTMLCYA